MVEVDPASLRYRYGTLLPTGAPKSPAETPEAFEERYGMRPDEADALISSGMVTSHEEFDQAAVDLANVDMGPRVEEMERPKAAERQAEGGRAGAERRWDGLGSTDPNPSEPKPERTADVVAEYGGAAFMVPSKSRPEIVARIKEIEVGRSARGNPKHLTDQEIADTAGVSRTQVKRDLGMDDKKVHMDQNVDPDHDVIDAEIVEDDTDHLRLS